MPKISRIFLFSQNYNFSRQKLTFHVRYHKKTSRLYRPNKYINKDQRGYSALSGDLNFLLSDILPHFTHLPSTSHASPSLQSPSFIFSPSTFTTPSHKINLTSHSLTFPQLPSPLILHYSFYTLTFSQLLSPQTLPHSSPPLTLNPFTFPQLSSPLIPSLSLHSHRGFLT